MIKKWRLKRNWYRKRLGKNKANIRTEIDGIIEELEKDAVAKYKS